MKYPKEVMRIKELEQMGFPREFLLTIDRLGIRDIAWKISPSKNSPILFDTEELEKYRKTQCLKI